MNRHTRLVPWLSPVVASACLAVAGCGGGGDGALPSKGVDEAVAPATDPAPQNRFHPLLNASSPGLNRMAQIKCERQKRREGEVRPSERSGPATRTQRMTQACQHAEEELPG